MRNLVACLILLLLFLSVQSKQLTFGLGTSYYLTYREPNWGGSTYGGAPEGKWDHYYAYQSRSGMLHLEFTLYNRFRIEPVIGLRGDSFSRTEYVLGGLNVYGIFKIDKSSNWYLGLGNLYEYEKFFENDIFVLFMGGGEYLFGKHLSLGIQAQIEYSINDGFVNLNVPLVAMFRF